LPKDEAMSAMLEGMRSGDWVTRERMRLVAFGLLIAYAGAFAYLALTASGLSDAAGRPLGTDFSNVYAAGTLVLDADPQAPFDPALQYAREQEIFGAATPFYGWHYPPFFLFVAAALALMPYKLSLLAWQAATLVLYLATLRAILADCVASSGAAPLRPRPVGGLREAPPSGTDGANPIADPLWLVLALAFPAVFVNLGHGHNGFLTAALIGAALVNLDRRPLLAGLLLGLLVYKPQFGILLPLVLAATGRWRTFAAAVATVAALFLITTLAFGVSVWDAFLASTHFTRTIVLEAGGTGWHKIQSVFSLVRMWGGPVALAYAVQSAVTLLLAVALVWLWRQPVDFALKAAALIIAALLATPYSLDYDMTALAPAIAFLAVHGLRQGFAPYEKTALAGLWIAPLVARSLAEAVLVPVGVLAMAAMLGLVLHRAAQETGLFARRHPFQHPAN
jgi:alpha-1,2-mannosyltransferase